MATYIASCFVEKNNKKTAYYYFYEQIPFHMRDRNNLAELPSLNVYPSPFNTEEIYVQVKLPR